MLILQLIIYFFESILAHLPEGCLKDEYSKMFTNIQKKSVLIASNDGDEKFRWDGSIKANVEARIFSAWNAFRKPPARVHTVVNEKYDKLVVSWVCCLCLQSCLHHILSRFNKVWWWTPERNEWIGKQTIFFNGKNTH